MQKTPQRLRYSNRHPHYLTEGTPEVGLPVLESSRNNARSHARTISIIAVSTILFLTGCTGGSSRGKWLEIGTKGQLINLDQVTDIVPGHDPNKLRFEGSRSGQIRFFSTQQTSVDFPSEAAANENYLRIIAFLKSNDHYLKL